jgi:hypothetical protein
MRARAVVAVAVAIALSLAGVASAAGPGRLAGTFKVRIKITQVKNVIGQHVGDTGVVKWKFIPKCATGGCATVLRRHTLDGKVVIEKLSVSAGNYREKWVQQTDCFNNKTGKLILRKAYKLTYVLKVHPTNMVNGVVTAFTAVAKTTSTVTAKAKAKGCYPASETWTGKSLG